MRALAVGVRVALVDEPQVHQLVDDLPRHADGDVVPVRQAEHGVGPLSPCEAFADEGEDEHAEEVVVATADVARLVGEVIVLEVLVAVAQFGTEEADAPGNLCPEEEERDGGEATVDGIVVGHPYLAVDVEELQHLEGGSGNESRDDGIAEAYPRVGHEDVKPRKDEARKYIRYTADDELGERREDEVAVEALERGGHEDGQTARDDQHDGQEQEDGEVVGNLAEGAALLLHLPYLVEGTLDVPRQCEDRPKQDEQAHPDEDAALCMGEIGVCQADDDVDGHRLPLQSATDLFLHHVGESQSACHGKEDGKNRHDGEQGVVGQRRCLVDDAVVIEPLDGEEYDLEDVVEDVFDTAHFVFSHSPDFLGEESFHQAYSGLEA